MSAFLSFAFELWLSLVFLLVLVTFKIFFLSDEQYIVVCPVHWTLMCVQMCVSLLCVCLVVTYFFFQMFNETHRSDIRGATYLLLYHLRHLGQKRYLCHVCGAVSPPPFFLSILGGFRYMGTEGGKKYAYCMWTETGRQTDRQTGILKSQRLRYVHNRKQKQVRCHIGHKISYNGLQHFYCDCKIFGGSFCCAWGKAYIASGAWASVCV
jgi:hypothetical protein